MLRAAKPTPMVDLNSRLIAGESGHEVGFFDAGVANQHHLEEVIVVVVPSVSRHLSRILGLIERIAQKCKIQTTPEK